MSSTNEKLDELRNLLSSQESYRRVNVGVGGGFNPNKPYDAILPASVDGDLQIVDGKNNTITIPQGALVAGQALQILVNEVKTGGSQTLSDIILLGN